MNPHAVALYIKGWEYIIAIIFNLAFLVFWFLVTRQRAGGQEQQRARQRASTGEIAGFLLWAARSVLLRQ